MANAVVAVQVVHGPTGSPSYGSAGGGVVWNRSDDELATKHIPAPTAAPSSVYANYKTFQLVIVTPGTTHIGNFGIRRVGAEITGSRLFAGSAGAYAQCTGDGDTQGNRPADSFSALAASPAPNTPAGYTPLVTGVTTFDTGNYLTDTPGPIGDALRLVCGLSSGYGGGGDDAAPQCGFYFRYSEA